MKAVESVFKSGFAAVVGRPNVGKSTLLNALLDYKVAIVSDKPQTTRNTIQCVLTRPDAQIVFLDTPGLHKPLHKLGEYMLKSALRALNDVDVVVWVVEMNRWTGADRRIWQELASLECPLILAVNKSDQVCPAQHGEFLEAWAARGKFAEILPISALEGTNLEQLADSIVARLKPGPKYYPDDWVTDQPERFLVAEFIREELLSRTKEEIPFSIAVYVDEIKEEPEKNLVKIRATVFVERESQKGIVIGKGGRLLKDWRNKPGALREFGYE